MEGVEGFGTGKRWAWEWSREESSRHRDVIEGGVHHREERSKSLADREV